MKETSDLDAELLISEEDEEHSRANNAPWSPHGHSNVSLHGQGKTEKNGHQGQSAGTSGGPNSKTSTTAADKRSRLDRIFGRKPSVASSRTTATAERRPNPSQSAHSLHAPTAGSSMVVPGRVPSAQRTNDLAATTASNSSTMDLSELKYLPVEEDDDDEPVVRAVDRNAEGIQPSFQDTGKEVKLHPTRAKTFALPKSLRNLKRRIASLRAKGTDLDAEKRERDGRERRRNGGPGEAAGEEKKKFTLIRLLPWKSSKRMAAVDVSVPTA